MIFLNYPQSKCLSTVLNILYDTQNTPHTTEHPYDIQDALQHYWTSPTALKISPNTSEDPYCNGTQNIPPHRRASLAIFHIPNVTGNYFLLHPSYPHGLQDTSHTYCIPPTVLKDTSKSIDDNLLKVKVQNIVIIPT